MPYRGQAHAPQLTHPSTLVIRCHVDLSRYETSDYAELFLGRIFGRSHIFLNNVLEIKQSDNGTARFPLRKDQRDSNATLNIVSTTTKN